MSRLLKIVLVLVLLTVPVQVGSSTVERKDMPDTLDKEKLKIQLVNHEGKKDHAYQDSEGYWTIGIGHLIDKRKGGKIDEDTIYYIFEKDLAEKIADLDQHLPWWRNLDEVRQRVLVDMCFNLGINKLLEFHNTLAYIESGDYKQAAVNMLKSLWARQVGNRAKTLAQMMEYGI